MAEPKHGLMGTNSSGQAPSFTHRFLGKLVEKQRASRIAGDATTQPAVDGHHPTKSM